MRRIGRVVSAALVGLATSGILLPPGLVSRTLASPPAASSVAVRWNRACRQMEATLEGLSRTTFDLRAAVDEAGKDPEALFQWVRDKTRWVAYRGLLRGAVGVLMDRVGNSLDRAVLLDALLRLAGHESRLARGVLPAGSIEGILERLPLPPDVPAAAAPAEAGGLDIDALGASEDAALSIQAQEGDLRQTLRPDPAAERGRVRDALQDHWWVQVKRDGQWLDLDPLLADAEAGHAAVPAAETLAVKDLSEDLRHRVAIRVVVERLAAGKRDEGIALEHIFRPHELIGRHVAFTNTPLGKPSAKPPAKTKAKDDTTDDRKLSDPEITAKLLDEYEKVREWLPVLSVEGERFSTRSVYLSGELNDRPNKTVESRKFSLARDKLRGGRTGQWTAEWLEYQVLSPGRDPIVRRRQIFDLLGPARRAAATFTALPRSALAGRGLALAGSTDILLPVCNYSRQFLTDVLLRFQVKNRKATLGLLYALETHDDEAARKWFLRMEKIPTQLYALAALRALWNPRGAQTFYDAPNILSTHVVTTRAEKASMTVGMAVDIAYNRLGVRRDALEDAATIRLLQGLADTCAETAALPPSARSFNTAVLHEAAAAGGTELVVLRGAGDAKLARLDLPPDDLARIRSALAQGLVVVAPARTLPLGDAEHVAWWRIDPVTGEALGIGLNGWGISLWERLQFEIYRFSTATGPAAVYASTLACLYIFLYFAVKLLPFFGVNVPDPVDWAAQDELLEKAAELCGRRGGGPKALPAPDVPKKKPELSPMERRAALKKLQLQILDQLEKEHGPASD